ncbi:signal recognition particle-docking protein FtsY [soil metagenome]
MARSWRKFFRKADAPAPTEAGGAVEDVEYPDLEQPAVEEEGLDQMLDPDTEPDNAQLEVDDGAPSEYREFSEAELDSFEPDFAPDESDDTGEALSVESGGWFGRLRQGLKRSRESMVGQLNAAIAEFKDADDEEFWEQVEEILISADVGVNTTAKLVSGLEQEALEKNITSGAELRDLMVEHATRMLEGPVELDVSHHPTVVLMVGVNGTGKTTTIGKLVNYLPGVVMLAAGDTFRAAAIEQLQTWGERTGATVVARERGTDAAAVAHEAIEESGKTGTDVLLIDTAGRLHTKINLMSELEKIRRVIQRRIPEAPHEVLMTVDATTGQNGLRQVKMFAESVELSGIILTKLDGTAKGGIVLSIADETGIPIKLISVGEKVGDLHPFDAREFAEALFGDL